MQEKKKPPLRELLKNRPPKKGRIIGGPQPSATTPPRGIPRTEGPIPTPKAETSPKPERLEADSIDLDVSELESPAPQKPPEPPRPSLPRIQNKAIEADIIKLFSYLIGKNATMRSMFRNLTPRIDESNNLIISGKEVGRVFRNEGGRIFVRIYLDRLKLRETDEKDMIGETFMVFSRGKHKYFNIDEGGSTFGFSEKEGGKPIMQNLAVEIKSS